MAAWEARMEHYHIRWGNSNLDWEAFRNENEATSQAEQLKRPGESYVIEQADGDCQRCKSLAPNLESRKSAISSESMRR